jgi:hypothetical protein
LNPLTRLDLNRKALRDLGFQQVRLYAAYRIGLRSGAVRRREANLLGALRSAGPATIASPLQLPDPQGILSLLPDRSRAAIAGAEEILGGQVRLFGGPPIPLQLAYPGPLSHWSTYEGMARTPDGRDIKWIWESGRFGWALTLARAFHLTGDDRYAASFWERFESFNRDNPPFLGPHWVSAQEVALRLIALAFSAQVFERSPRSTPERREILSLSLAAHAVRLPLTLDYARAQNNNHLLTEAAGLVTAGAYLPGHPQASEWEKLGWHWLQEGFQSQIDQQGAYTQHSANYHRLMLQTALWVQALGKPFPAENCRRLAAATHWLLALLDPATGRVPNLGPNDGAYILPLTSLSWSDFRPVLQAASLAFLGGPAFERGPWDEMALWLVDWVKRGDRAPHEKQAPGDPTAGPHTLHQKAHPSWAYLRVARFTGRPGHADQLHLDLWWQGHNIAQDAGTYLYNASPPWDNALAGTEVHNTLTIAGRDQMTRAGRFLWLDWAQARVIAPERAMDRLSEHLVAEHDGYRQLGLVHRRSVTAHGDGRWTIEDSVLPSSKLSRGSKIAQLQAARLHWLLPDWPWQHESLAGGGGMLRLESPGGWVGLKIWIESVQPMDSQFTLARAGELLFGAGPVAPTWGWVSPTYGIKEPALSFSLLVKARPPLKLFSEWNFP